MDWLTRRFRDAADGESGPLQIMYGIDGRAELPEEELSHLEGYRGSAPVRIGNGAADQLQLDIYGELIDSVYLYNKYGHADLPRRLDRPRPDRRVAVRALGPARRGDLGDPRRPPALHLLAADVLGRGRARDPDRPPARPARRPPPLDSGPRQRSTARSCSAAGTPRRRAFVQHYDTDVLDASLLLMPLVQVHRADRPALALDARRDQPRSWSPTASSTATTSTPRPTGSAARRATFSMCTFWYVEALARAGRLDEARLALREDAHLRQPPRALRRGDRAHRRAARQLPPSLHAPRADQRRLQPRPPTRLAQHHTDQTAGFHSTASASRHDHDPYAPEPETSLPVGAEHMPIGERTRHRRPAGRRPGSSRSHSANAQRTMPDR